MKKKKKPAKPKKKAAAKKPKKPTKKAASKPKKPKAPRIPTPGQAKKEVWAALKKGADFDQSGLDEAENWWAGTLGNFFTRYGAAAEKKWKLKGIKNYAMDCVRAIAAEAKFQAGIGGKVDQAIMRAASRKIIDEYRLKLCPPQVAVPQPNTPTTNTQLNGQLCELV